MNLPFDVVINSQVNKSKTKQTHAFPKEERFKMGNSQILFNDHYDLHYKTISANLKKRNRSFSQAQRFIYQKDETPSPFRYNIKGTFQNIQKKNGPKASDFKRQQKSMSPGPGAYNPPIINEKILKFSFGQRTKIPQKNQVIGPGSYKIQKYGSFNSVNIAAKYQKSQECKILQSKRFMEKDDRRNYPSPQNYKIQLKKQNSYSFGVKKRETISNTLNITPGPGAYPIFSQFSARKKGIQSKLNRLQNLIKQNKNT